MYDSIIIGAGPVGLAIAIELARRDLAVLVLDRRPPLAGDARVRPQLLVARAGDLAALAHLGLDVEDDWLVSLLASRTEADLASGLTIRGDVLAPRAQLTRPTDLWALARQPPLALVPIGRLQLRLLEQAERAGAEVRYGCEVTKLRRHAREVSLTCADGQTERAAIAIVATGAARALIASPGSAGARSTASAVRSTIASPGSAGARSTASAVRSTIAGTEVVNAPDQRLLSGVFATSGDRATWLRVEVPVTGHARSVRCTMLQTPTAGTALLVDPQLAGDAPAEQLHRCFDVAASTTGLAGAPFLAAPQVFSTAVSTVTKRSLAGDGRAPVVIAGDAAQTGHVFSGSTCFVNLALALRLCDELAGARTALVDRAVGSPALLRALARYDRQSELGAAILAQASARHATTLAAGKWALAGVARA